jgi:hypothetical protein
MLFILKMLFSLVTKQPATLMMRLIVLQLVFLGLAFAFLLGGNEEQEARDPRQLRPGLSSIKTFFSSSLSKKPNELK